MKGKRWKQCGYGFLSILLLAVTVMLCSKDKSSNPPAPTAPKAPPKVRITNPSIDSTVASNVDSVTIGATITDTNTVGVDSVYVNNIKSGGTPFIGTNISARVRLATDTTTIIVRINGIDKSTHRDTVTIYKSAVVNQNKAKVSGTLLKEASGARMGKFLPHSVMGRNAQGQTKTVYAAVPASGADVMFYNSATLSTKSDTIVKTDSLGKWNVELEPGKYFIFVVYFDKDNLELVTTSLPDISAEKKKETKTDTTTAITDDVKPTLMTFLDAGSATDNIFVAGSIPSTAPIVMTFSEPMNRVSVGDSIRGIVLGAVNDTSTELTMLDTIPVQKVWGPNGKELRLIPQPAKMIVGKTYKVVIPTTVKDLALNKIEASYSGIFKVIAVAELELFAIKKTFPATGDTIVAGTALEIIFSRPVDMLSLNQNFVLRGVTDTLIKAYFEGKGMVAKLINTKPWTKGETYTLTVRSATKDLIGDTLKSPASVTFTIRPKDQLEQEGGIKGAIAAVVNQFFAAFIAGDLEAFGQYFHKNLEVIERNRDNIEERILRDKFMEARRKDIDERNLLTKFGFLAPVFYKIVLVNDSLIAWKLVKGNNTVYFEDLGPQGGFGRIPRVFNSSKVNITSSVQFMPRAVIVNGDTLYFAPDMSKTFINAEARDNDPGFFGKLLKEQTNVEVQSIFVDMKTTFVIKKDSIYPNQDSAQMMIEMMDEFSYRDKKYPFGILDQKNAPPEVSKSVQAIQARLVKELGKWYVIQLVVKKLWDGDKNNFKPDSIKQADFIIQNVNQTKPIILVKPAQKAVGVSVPITFSWKKPVGVTAGGYLFAIGDEKSGGNRGLLVYTRDTFLIVKEDASLDTSCHATMLTISPQSLHVPLPRFNTRLERFSVKDSAIYAWKVVAISDTTATQVASNIFMVIADSDFGPQSGVGIFTLLGAMPDITNKIIIPNTVEDHFSDRDKDGYPDWIEKAFATNPDDPGSYPDFTLDSDMDLYPDFMESYAKSNPMDSTSKPVDLNANKIADTLEHRPEWNPILAIDADKDGFPNEVEIIFGTDPWNSNSKPGKSIKPSVPIGKYYGALKLGDVNSTTPPSRMYFTITSDSSGDFVLADSIKLEGLAKDGKSLTMKLYFQCGEWVYYIPVASGPNTGKFFKVRCKSGMVTTKSGSMVPVLMGPVDLADKENGGGPMIGNFLATTDPTLDFSSINQGNNNPIPGPNNNTGPLVLGPAPAQQLIRPDSNTFDLRMSLFYDTVKNMTSDSLTISTQPLFAPAIFWMPGQFPSFNSKIQNGGYVHMLDGNLHRQGMKPNDTLVLVGNYKLDSTNGMQKGMYQFTLKLSGYGTNDRRPLGNWIGWYSTNMPNNNNNSGPLPFIGQKSALDSALALTRNKAVVRGFADTLTIDTVYREGATQDPSQQANGPWCALNKITNKSYFILEKPGDWSRVFVARVKVGGGNDSIAVIMLTAKGGAVNIQDIPYWSADSSRIMEALRISGSMVLAFMGPGTPCKLQVDTASICKVKSPNNPDRMVWTIRTFSQPVEYLMFLSPSGDSTKLSLENNVPRTMRMEVIQGTIPFEGDSLTIAGALQNSQNRVRIPAMGGLNTCEVNPVTVRQIVNPKDQSKRIWIVTSRQNTSDNFIFIAMAASPKVLLKDMEIPQVERLPGVNGGVQPFVGDTLNVRAALTKANNQVRAQGADTMQSVFVIVNPGSLRSVKDPKEPSKILWVVNSQNSKSEIYFFLAPQGMPNVLFIEGDVPKVRKLESMPFVGDSISIIRALDSSTCQVKVAGNTNVITVVPATVRQFTVPGSNPLIQVWLVSTQGQQGVQPENFAFLQDPDAVTPLIFKDNKIPIVKKITLSTRRAKSK